MNGMSIPGFTADASLYRTSASYSSTPNAYTNGEQQVAPQFWKEVWGGIKRAASAVLSVGCSAACGVAGAQITAGCTIGSEGLAAVECAAIGAAVSAGCSKLC
jgi:hypothetical protein